MDESNNALLDAFAKTFAIDNMLKTPCNVKMDANLLDRCFSILNEHFFLSSLPKIPLMYESDAAIRKFLMNRKTKRSKIPSLFFGVHSVICENDIITSQNDKLDLHDDVILLNSNHINGRSISFLVACLCHEMIHYYDRLFGEYCDFIKYTMMTGIEVNKHNTATFEIMKEKANDLGVNVIQEIPIGKNAKILDKEAIALLFKKAQEEGLILENGHKKKDTESISYFHDRPGCVINTF